MTVSGRSKPSPSASAGSVTLRKTCLRLSRCVPLTLMPAIGDSPVYILIVHGTASAGGCADGLCRRVRSPYRRHSRSLVSSSCFITALPRQLSIQVRRRSLWNPATSEVLFSEIKGPGDQLSETQKVWIDVLLAAGVGVEVVKVIETKERRDETPDDEDGEDEEATNGDEAANGKKRKKRKTSTKAASTRARSRSRSESVKKEGTPVRKRPAARSKRSGSGRGAKTAEETIEEQGVETQELVLFDSD